MSSIALTRARSGHNSQASDQLYAAAEKGNVFHPLSWYVCLQAVVALLLPTHFFYTFLYYTDMGAVTLIMASYLVRHPEAFLLIWAWFCV